jgi:ADP-heptose:LPS heptosyltransferase
MTSIRRITKQLLFGTPRPPSRAIQNILVIRRNGIGDMLCAFPLLRALRKAHPAARLTVLADPANAEAARCCEAVDEVLVFPLRPRLVSGRTWEAWRTARELRKRRYDAVIGVSGSFSRLLAQMVYGTGAGIRAGTLPPERVAEPFYYSHYRVRYDASRTHQILAGAEILKSMGIDCDPNAIELRVSDAEAEWARAWIAAKLDASKPIVWLHLSNRRAESRWEASRFRELAHRLVNATDAGIVLARAPDDPHFQPSEFESLPTDRAAWFETGSFKQLAAGLARSQVAVCGDGGVMHLGAAVGTRVVAMFSGTEPEIWRPWGASHIVLRRGEDVDLISADEVFRAVVEFLKFKV